MKIRSKNVCVLTDKWSHIALVSEENGVFYVTLTQRNYKTNRASAPRKYNLRTFEQLCELILKAKFELQKEIAYDSPKGF